MSVNERLLVSGLLDKFEAAARLGNRKQMVALLMQADVSKNHAALWVDTLLADHASFHFWKN